MDSLGSTREIIEKKLIILYIIDRIQVSLVNLQIVKIVLENKSMDYFMLQQFLDELVVDNMLDTINQNDRKEYHITKKGADTLEFFINKIPLGRRKRIDDYIAEMRKEIKSETLITADFFPENGNDFIVTLAIREDSFPLIKMEVTVGTQKDAKQLCQNWNENPQAIYTDILNCLLKKRDESDN